MATVRNELQAFRRAAFRVAGPNFSYLRGLCVATLALFVAAGCAGSPREAGPVVARPAPDSGAPPAAEAPTRYDERSFVAPIHMQGQEPVRVALLLPFSATGDAVKKIAAAMFDAAQLASFEAGDDRFLLLPKDTGGTAEGAAAAARSALADGAEIMLGPLFAEEVTSVAPISRAARVPLVAFSSDVASAGDGVYLLSFPPEIEVARVTEYAVSRGIYRFGLLAPASDFGARVSTAFAGAVGSRGATLVHEERYEQSPDAMLAPARRLAAFARPGAAPDGSQDGLQAVMLPEQGTLLRALAPLLPYYNVDVGRVKLLGLSAWNNPRLTREPALRGGWFAAPDPAISANFINRYRAAFGEEPPKLASLSYDATLLAARLAQSPRRRGRLDEAVLVNPNGYFGADGLFRLRGDGRIERGLAILEIQPGGVTTLDPAPQAFTVGF